MTDPDGPDTLLRDLLAALARSDRQNADPAAEDGVARLYGCASERMRGAIGDLASFRRAFRNELYAPLLGHGTQARVGPFERHGDSVRATVSVTAEDGTTATYLFALGLSRHGERAGTWVLNGVVREGVDL